MLKIVSQMDTTPVVHPTDDAIDRDKSDVKKYEETHDIAHLVFSDNKRPTIFHVGVMSAVQGDELDVWRGSVEWDESGEAKARAFKGEFNDAAKFVKAFRYCVRRIENLDGVKVEGNTGFDRLGSCQVVAQRVMEQLPRYIVVDVGRIALKLNTPKEEDRKN